MLAAKNNHVELVSYLVHLTDKLNAENTVSCTEFLKVKSF